MHGHAFPFLWSREQAALKPFLFQLLSFLPVLSLFPSLTPPLVFLLAFEELLGKVTYK